MMSKNKNHVLKEDVRFSSLGKPLDDKTVMLISVSITPSHS